jgi:hypothetical protein
MENFNTNRLVSISGGSGWSEIGTGLLLIGAGIASDNPFAIGSGCISVSDGMNTLCPGTYHSVNSAYGTWYNH